MSAADYTQHEAYLKTRGVDRAFWDAAGLEFLDPSETRSDTGIKSASIKIPYSGIDGKDIGFYRWRLLDPSANPNGAKFHQKAKTGVFAYLPPFPKGSKQNWLKVAKHARVPIVITEGEIKALAAMRRGIITIGIGGVDSWQTGGKPLAIWEEIVWKGRETHVCFDSDQTSNRSVLRAQLAYADYLKSMGAVVSIRVLYDATMTGKTGLDDFLATRTLDDYHAAPLYALDSPVVNKWRSLLTDTTELPEFDITPVPTDWLESKLPPMEYTVEGYLPRGVVSMLVAEGGVGKTNFALQLAEAVASGEPFFGMKTHAGVVVFLALEDPPDILRRRIHRIYENRAGEIAFAKDTKRAKSYAKLIRSNLVLSSLVGQQLHLVGMTKGVVSQSPALDALISKLKGAGVELVILDPMSRLHGADENANAIGTAVVNAAERIAREVGCTVLISHHTGKANAASQNETAYAARGASGIADAARVVLRLRKIDEKEKCRINNLDADELQRDVLRLVHAKSNYAPSAADLWLKRGEFGEFTAFAPRFRDEADDYTEFLAKLRAWAIERGAPFSKRTVTDNDLAKIFHGSVSQKSARKLVDEAITRGDIITTGAKSKGGGDELAMREVVHAPRKF